MRPPVAFRAAAWVLDDGFLGPEHGFGRALGEDACFRVEHDDVVGHLLKSPADWISPNPDGGYRDDPPATDGRKVILSDTDHLWGIGGSQAWVWKSFTRGYNVLFMDPYDGEVLGQPLDPKWDPVRWSLGYTLQYARRMDLAQTRPAPRIFRLNATLSSADRCGNSA